MALARGSVQSLDGKRKNPIVFWSWDIEIDSVISEMKPQHSTLFELTNCLLDLKWLVWFKLL